MQSAPNRLPGKSSERKTKEVVDTSTTVVKLSVGSQKAGTRTAIGKRSYGVPKGGDREGQIPGPKKPEGQ